MPRQDLHSMHRIFLSSCGGILSRWNEPEGSLLANLNWALVEASTGEPVEGWYEYYREQCEAAGTPATVSEDDYLAFAVEANGNTSFYNRTTADVILFAPDHNYDNVSVLDGAPEYTLYRLNAIHNLRDWVEAVAQQWLATIRE